MESIYKGITDSGVGGKINTIKEQIYGDMLKKAAENYPGFVKFDEKVIDENGEILTDKLNEKGNRVQDLLKYFASSIGYEGEIPRILIGDLSPGEEAFASTSDNTIAIDRNILASADSNKILSILAHELGHFNGYDSGTESTASRVENAVSGAVSKKESTGDYEAYFKNMYEGKDISGKEAQKIIDGIPEENKEKIGGGVSYYGLDVYNPNLNENEKSGIKFSIGLAPSFPFSGEIHTGTINESTVIGGVDEFYLIEVENGIIKSIDKNLNLKGVNYWKSR